LDGNGAAISDFVGNGNQFKDCVFIPTNKFTTGIVINQCVGDTITNNQFKGGMLQEILIEFIATGTVVSGNVNIP
jgi:hypothetical protein